MPKKGNTIFIGRRGQIIQLPDRYNEKEWKEYGRSIFTCISDRCKNSEQVAAESFRTASAANEINEKLKQNARWELERRVKDIAKRKNELKIKYDQCVEEGDKMRIFVKRCENLMATFPPVMETDKEIMRHRYENEREARISIDLVDDEPHKELTKEMKLIDQLKLQSEKALQEAQEMMRLLRKCNYELDLEIKNKERALAVDEKALNFNEHHFELVDRRITKDLSSFICHVDNETEWEDMTQRFKVKADKLIETSENLRSKLSLFCVHVCESLQLQVARTNFAFTRRIKNIRRQKDEFEHQNVEISIRIREMEDVIDKMKKSWNEMQSSLTLAEARFAIRDNRPHTELVKDAAYKTLQGEVIRLRHLVNVMEQQIVTSKASLKQLLLSQMALHEAINVKVVSLAIDETQVMPLRETITIGLQ